MTHQPGSATEKSFGDQLRRLRRAANLTQEDLASASGVSPRTISELERGARRAPQAGSAEMLASALGLSGADREAFFAGIRQHRTPPGPKPVIGGVLPQLAGETVGREEELAAIGRRFAEGDRLVTLTGPGGVGKTRIASEYAHRVSGDAGHVVIWTGCEALTEPSDVLPAVVRAAGAVERPGVAPQALLGDLLQGRSALLVLDNMEHLLSSGADVLRLLEALPQARVLATSREGLRVRPEGILQV
ncbi:MAG: helix-turn-helix domain-containing protein, partial [Thermomicrobiales bacterium]